MATIPELIRLYIKGLKRLFFLEGESGKRGRLSLIKILIFIAFILAYFFAFLQFVEGNIPETDKQGYINEGDIEKRFPLSIYGNLAHLMNFIIILGFLFFLYTREKPLGVVTRQYYDFCARTTKQYYDFCTRSGYNAVAGIGIPLILVVFILYQIYRGSITISIGNPIDDITTFSYYFGRVFYLWIVVLPVMMFGAALATLDVFANDHPELMRGYNKRNVSFFIVCIIIAIAAMIIIYMVFNISLANEPKDEDPPFSIEGLDEVYFYGKGLWWIVNGINITLSAVFILMIIEIITNLKLGPSEIRERRKASSLVILPFVLIYVFLKAFPLVMTFGPRLKSLENIVDLASLSVIIFFGIFQVLAIEEKPDKQDSIGRKWYNPKKWLDLVPPYCKVLAFFFLAFTSYYASIEANAILTFTGLQNAFRLAGLAASIGMVFPALCYVVWRYKPFVGTTSPDLNNRVDQANDNTS
ncbi:MAG: hypothetical protein ACXADA_09880 [Candidatus Hodarchaeales archaeon]|jgi:hypothetical protein